MATTRTFEIRSKQDASDIITAIHNNFFENDNDEMVIEEIEDDNGNITVYGWNDSRYYNERKVPENKRCTYYISPCFGEIELPKIIDFMKEKNLIKRVRFQIQVHKIVWDPQKRGV